MMIVLRRVGFDGQPSFDESFATLADAAKALEKYRRERTAGLPWFHVLGEVDAEGRFYRISPGVSDGEG